MERQHLRVFVACGTTPFDRLLETAQALLADDDLEVFAQRGTRATRFRHVPGVELIGRDEFSARLRWADVVVCHGGAGTLWQAHRAGHRPIAMPRLARFREHVVNDHQQELVEALERRGLAVWLREGDDLHTLVRRAGRRSSEPMPEVGSLPLTRAVGHALVAASAGERTAKVRELFKLPRAIARRVRTRR